MRTVKLGFFDCVTVLLAVREWFCQYDFSEIRKNDHGLVVYETSGGDELAFQSTLTFEGAPHLLSKRKNEILGLIDQGLSNKEIAKPLLLVESTVKNHVINIFGKLQVNKRTLAPARGRERKVI